MSVETMETVHLAPVGQGEDFESFVAATAPRLHRTAVLLCREAGAVVCERDGTPSAWPEHGPFVAAPPGLVDELRSLLA